MTEQQRSFGDWFITWDAGREVSESRRKADQSRYHKYVEPKFGSRAVQRVSAKDIQNHIDGLLEQGVGPFTVDAVLAVIRGVLKAAVDGGDLKRNAAAGIAVEAAAPMPDLKVEDVLTDKQLADLESAINPNYQALIRLGGYYGLSWSEAIGLKVDDLDIRNRTLTVGRLEAVETNGRIGYRHGKGRQIGLDKDTVMILAEHILSTEPARSRADEPWLFVTERGTHPLRPNFNVWFLRPALEKIGLEGVTYHTLRHTAARRMLERGLSFEQVASTLGHASVVTTKRMYGKFAPAPTIRQHA